MLTAIQRTHAANIKLSENFRLLEMIDSATYPEHVEWPSEEIQNYLTTFAEKVLQPIRNKFGKIRINSGWRPEKLNNAVGGEKKSIHQILYKTVYIGVAADIVPLEAEYMDVYHWVHENIFPVKNIILYRKTAVTRNPFLHVDTRTSTNLRTKLEKFGPGDYRHFSE